MRKTKIAFYLTIISVAVIAIVVSTDNFLVDLLINILGIIIFIIIAKIAKNDAEFLEWLDQTKDEINK